MQTPGILDAVSRRKIAAEGLVTERRVLLAYRDPDSVSACTLSRITKAAKALGLPIPSKQPAGTS